MKAGREGGRERCCGCSSPVGVAMALPSLLTEPFPVFDLKSLFRAIPPLCSAFMSQLGVQRDEHSTKIRSPFTTEATCACTHRATSANPSVSCTPAEISFRRYCSHDGDVLRSPDDKNSRVFHQQFPYALLSALIELSQFSLS